LETHLHWLSIPSLQANFLVAQLFTDGRKYQHLKATPKVMDMANELGTNQGDESQILGYFYEG